MSDYLGRLATRALGAAPAVRPRLPGRFEGSGMSGGLTEIELSVPAPPATSPSSMPRRPGRARPPRRPEAAAAPPPRGEERPKSLGEPYQPAPESGGAETREPARLRPEPEPTIAPPPTRATAEEPTGGATEPTGQPPSRRAPARPARPPQPATRPGQPPAGDENRAHEPGSRARATERRAAGPTEAAEPAPHPTISPPPRPTASPAPPPARRRRGGEPPAPAPVVEVSIGRVEIRAITESPAAAPRPRRGPRLTLESYLAKRGGGAG